MFGYVLTALVSACAGGYASYWVAKKYPHVFGIVVSAVNTASDAAKAEVAKRV